MASVWGKESAGEDREMWVGKVREQLMMKSQS